MTYVPTGHVRFHLDEPTGIVIVTPHWHIKTMEDVRAWAAEYDKHFQRYAGRKVDVIFVLSSFLVEGRVGVAWGEARAAMVHRFTRYSYRVGASGNAKTYTLTSGVRYSAASALVDTIEEGIAAILRQRQEEGE